MIFALKTQMLMAGGAVYGRLAMPPVYDDVYYFVVALQGLQIFRDHGMLSFLFDAFKHPPHAPYSYFAAFLAFLFTTGSTAMPYFMNALAVSVITLFLTASFRFSITTIFLLSLIMISLTWFDQTITIFHPDLIAGYGTAAVAAVLVWQDWALRKGWQAILAGVAAGLILLVKPVAIGMVAAIWTSALLAGIATAGLRRAALVTSVRRLLPGMLAAAVVAGPYYISELRNIIDYVELGFVTQRDIWIIPMSPSEHLTFYLRQTIMLFHHWVLFSSGIVFVTIAFALHRSERIFALRFLILLMLGIFAYAIPTAVEVKKLLFGAGFYGVSVVVIIISVGTILEWTRTADGSVGSSWRATHWILTLGIIGWALVSIGDGQMRVSSQKIADAGHAYREAYGLIERDYAYRALHNLIKAPTLIAYFPCPFPVAPLALQFRALREGLPLVVTVGTYDTQVQTVVEAARAANFVIIPDDKLLHTSSYPFPVNRIVPDLRNWIAHSPEFNHFGRIRLVAGDLEIYSDLPAHSDEGQVSP
jgi:hypothetical protein